MIGSIISFSVFGISRVDRVGGRVLETPKAWADAVSSVAGSYMTAHGLDMLTGPVGLHLEFYLPDRHTGNGDDLCKAVIGALRHTCYENDSQITERHIFMDLDTKSPRVEVEVFASFYGKDLVG